MLSLCSPSLRIDGLYVTPVPPSTTPFQPTLHPILPRASLRVNRPNTLAGYRLLRATFPRLPARALSYDSAVANHRPPRRQCRILTHSPRHLSSYLTSSRRLPYFTRRLPSFAKHMEAPRGTFAGSYRGLCSEQCSDSRPHLVSITKPFDQRC
ncbi:hypothetical protein K523DRAFT_321128 [Schizophyllum commune Tattone D]|nr:hypothetical protein K523DRAFT_321128 [Schizophyllum commune Tattone D]